MMICNVLADLWREENRARGYSRSRRRSLRLELCKQSGHWDKYREHMYLIESRTARWASSR